MENKKINNYQRRDRKNWNFLQFDKSFYLPVLYDQSLIFSITATLESIKLSPSLVAFIIGLG